MKTTIGPCPGNIFADLGFLDADERCVKSDLTCQITKIIQQKKLSPAKAAKLLGISPQQLHDLIRGKFISKPFDIFFKYLSLLGYEVAIDISKQKVKRVPAGVSKNKTQISKKKPKVLPKNISREPVSIHAKKRK